MNEKRINEIKARKDEVRKTLNNTPDMTLDNLRKLTIELEGLDGEQQQLEERAALLGRLGPESTPENKPADVQRSVQEVRGEQLRKGGGISFSTDEMRSVLFSGGNISAPKGNGPNVADPRNTVSSIIDMVHAEDMAGMTEYTETFIEAWQEASDDTEGTAATESNPTFGIAKVTPKRVSVITYVSKDIFRQTNVQLEDKVRRGAMIALRQKVARLIQSSSAASGPAGLYHAKSFVEEGTPKDMFETLEVATNKIDEKTLRNIVLDFGGDDNVVGGAVLFLNKKDLLAFGDVRGTNEKKPLYEITPDTANTNTGIIKEGGVSVRYCICSALTALTDAAQSTAKTVPTMVYGVPNVYTLGLFGPFEVTLSKDYKFAEGLVAVMGEAMIGGNIMRPECFQVVTLAKKTA